MDLLTYKEFVRGLLSEESKNFEAMVARLQALHTKHSNINIPALLTAADGMAAEAGEFMEIVKKIQWQGKELTEENRYHLMRELGDILFYVMVACIALDHEMQELIDENVEKLESRYPGGKFEVHHSENRKEGDL
jgi:NTP pyrophosphatase (non-canonical NTP hydrolase)